MRLRSYVIIQGVILVLPFLVFGLPKVFFHLVLPGWKVTQNWDLFLERNLATQYPAFWIVVAVVLLISAILWFRKYDEDNEDIIMVSILTTLACVMSLSQFGNILWNNKDFPTYYNKSTTFVVADIKNPPASLQRLLEGARKDNEACERIGAHDVPSCIRSGEFPANGWENRSASLAGAVRVMRQTSGESQQVNLRANTLAHIYPKQSKSIATDDKISDGYWTGIRDGKGIRIPTEGIVEWDGINRPTNCEFKGEYEFNRAIGGSRSNSLIHLLADKFPELRFNKPDIYGYCDHDNGDEPIIVVPVYEQGWYRNHSVEVPAGVLLLRGSPSGDPVFEHKRTVEPGEVPGPVYPLSIAEIQRGEHIWAAGREHLTRSKFGFEPTSAASQSDNATEFLLRSREDGRTYWVSPLTPRGSDSQLVLAYTLIPADTVTGGQLNEMTIYVFDREDPHVVNLDQMERDIRDFVSRQNPGFFSAKGKIQELTPASGTTWRAFGVLDGDPRFVVTIDPNGNNRPIISDIRGQTVEVPEQEPSETEEECSLPLAEQTNEQLFKCARATMDELERREATEVPAKG